MIKSEITAYVNSYEYSGEIIVPSQVLTSTKQEEELNLAYSPNFTLKLNDAYSYINDMVEVSFSYGDTDYTAYANVINRSAGVVTLQYNGGLTSSYAPPVIHTLEFSHAEQFYTYYDKYTDTITQSESTYLLYDGNKVENPMTYLDNQMGLGGSYTMGIPSLNSIYWIPNSASKNNEVGEYSDRFTATYEGLTTYCDVTAVISDSTPEP